MQQTMVGTKYQMVVPKGARKIMKSYKPGSRVVVHPIDENTATLKVTPKSWVEETYGMMREAWKGIDTEVEHRKIADEWEEKMEELGRGIKK